MGRGRVAAVVALALVTSGCARGEGPSPSPTPSATASPTPSGAPSPSRAPTATTGACDAAPVLALVDGWMTRAHLPAAAWSGDIAGAPFADRTVTGEAYAARLGFDCGIARVGDVSGEPARLLVAAWTGPRMAWVVQTGETPATPYAPDAMVTVVVGETQGEFLDGDARAVWAGTLDTGETFVVGHVDASLGAAAKDWYADRPPFDDPDDAELVPAERHAIAVLDAAGMRGVGIAEPAEIGSEEGHVMFVSPTGQISVVDVAPTGWFDPMSPRYVQGSTRFETIDGAQVRITEPGPDDRFPVGAEVGFACDGFVWLLQPPLNGGVDEMLQTATAILATTACRG